MGGGGEGSSLEETAAFAAAAVCFVLIFFSILVEYIIHLIGHCLKSRNKIKLYEALEKIKSEFMLLGFMSLLLTVSPESLSKICIKAGVAESWSPCKRSKPDHRHRDRDLLSRRTLAGDFDEGDGSPCKEGEVQFISQNALHELHIFIFVLACVHVLSCLLTMALGKIKMKNWHDWEMETTTTEYQSSHDPGRLRYIRETSFGQRHIMGCWTSNPILLRILCFFRQFYSSAPKVDYLTLRHGFIMAHLAPQHRESFNFQTYIDRSLEEDFKVVVGISPTIWFAAVVSLLFNKYNLYHSLWVPAIPVLILLLVGTKLQVIIAKMAWRIHETREVVAGAPVVQLGDDLFWFNSPKFLLFLMNFVLFENAFQVAFYVHTWMKYGIKSCFHRGNADKIIIICMGFLVIILCSYVTLPLYALVTQMGTNLKPTIFSANVANAVKEWYLNAKKRSKNSEGTTSQIQLLPIHIQAETQTLASHDSDDETDRLELADQAPHPLSSSSDRSYEIGLVEMPMQRSASEGTRSKEFPFVRRTQSSSVEYRR